jgi:hypothetical protein
VFFRHVHFPKSIQGKDVETDIPKVLEWISARRELGTMVVIAGLPATYHIFIKYLPRLRFNFLIRKYLLIRYVFGLT